MDITQTSLELPFLFVLWKAMRSPELLHKGPPFLETPSVSICVDADLGSNKYIWEYSLPPLSIVNAIDDWVGCMATDPIGSWKYVICFLAPPGLSPNEAD